MVAAVATLPGLGVGTLWDNSETAYGEVAREILIFKDPIVLHFNAHPWFVQPPLYFWVAALFAHFFGLTEFALRLPSALATIAMAATVGYVVARLTTSRAALLAAVVLSTSLMQAVVGRLAIMDALLDLSVALTILAGFAALRTGGRRWWYAGWLSLGFGVLAKGPVAIAIAALVLVPWAVWERRTTGRLVLPSAGRWLLGFALFAAVVGPWAVLLDRAAGFGALGELVGHYTFGRYLGTIENQSGPLYYYVPVVILGTFPWFAFLIPATIEGARVARRTDNGSLARLCLVWEILPFVFFSLAKTKLPNYIALELPALAILVALWFDDVVERDDRRAALAWTAVVPWTVAGLAFAIWAFSHDNKLTHDLELVRAQAAGFGFSILLGSALCFAFLLRKPIAWLAPFALGAAGLIAVLIALSGEPLVERFKPIPPLAAAIQREREPGDVVAIEGVSGGNALLFYTQPPVASLDAPDDPSAAATALRQTVCGPSRAFIVTSGTRPQPDPTYGRRRSIVARAGKDVLYLYDGPRCSEAN